MKKLAFISGDTLPAKVRREALHVLGNVMAWTYSMPRNKVARMMVLTGGFLYALENGCASFGCGIH